MIVHDRVPRRPSRPARVVLALAAVAALVISGRIVQADPLADEPKDDAPAATADEAKPEAASPMVTDPLSNPAVPAEGSAAELDQILPAEGDFRGGYAPPGMPGSRGMAGAGRGRGPGAMGSRPVGARGMGMMPGMAGGYRGPSRLVQLSAEVREKMIASLVAVIEQPDQPAEVKAQALRSLGQIGQGSPAAEEALLAAADRVKDDKGKLAVAEALNAVGSAKGIETMWSLLESTTDWPMRITVVKRLTEAGAVPATPETVRTLAWLAARGIADAEKANEARRKANNGVVPAYVRNVSPFEGAEAMLRRLTESGDGVRLLAETLHTADAKVPSGFVDTAEGSKSRIEDLYGPNTPASDYLLPLLASTVPATDEIAVALVEALSDIDPAIREAAAQALGNAKLGAPPPEDGFGPEDASGPPEDGFGFEPPSWK